jgi:hypothetical protein
VEAGGGASSWTRQCLVLPHSETAAAARSLTGRNKTPEFAEGSSSALSPPRAEPVLYSTSRNVGDESVHAASNGLPPTDLSRLLIIGAEAGHTSQEMALLLQRNLTALESATMTLAAILKQGIPQPGPSLTGSPVPGDPAKLPAKSGAHPVPLPEGALLPATQSYAPREVWFRLNLMDGAPSIICAHSREALSNYFITCVSSCLRESCTGEHPSQMRSVYSSAHLIRIVSWIRERCVAVTASSNSCVTCGTVVLQFALEHPHHLRSRIFALLPFRSVGD